MHTPLTAAQAEQLRRDAKRLARDESIPLNQALDRLAVAHGFRNWSLLSKHSSKAGVTPAPSPSAPRRDLRPRHYLHGDQDETEASKYYCAQCDLLVEARHFETHGDEKYERVLTSLQRWQRVQHESSRSRPVGAPNLLEAEALRRQAAAEARRSPFHRWLESQKTRNDPIGDLAQDVLGDRRFPADATDLGQVRGYLQSLGAIPEAPRALNAAWKEFAKTTAV